MQNIREEYNMILYEKKNKIAYITFNQPQKGNIINLKMADELIRIWKDFRDDDKLWVAILSGNGNTFCGGYDLNEIKGKWTIAKSLLYGEKKIGPSNYNIWKPIIAAVHGYVPGIGLYLTLECDLKIAAEDTKFSLPEPKFNLPTSFTPFISNHLLLSHALELLLTGKKINAKRAYEMGIINKIVPREQLIKSSEELAMKLCELGPLSIRAIKEVFYRSRGKNYQYALSLIEEIFTPIMNSEDVLEGKRAFFEKRKPQWKMK